MRRAWLALVLAYCTGCYAVPATHSVEPDPVTDGDGGDSSEAGDEDAGEMDAGRALDSGSEDAAGEDAAVGRDAAEDAGAKADASRCRCADPAKQVCIESSGACVECQEDKHCGAGKRCLALTGMCVGCLSQKDCAANPAASACDLTTHSCVACKDGMDNECADVAGLNVCNAGRCVQCAGSRRSACGETKAACSSTNLCEGCKADADCARFHKVCDEPAGLCVGCTSDSEAAQCQGNSCNPQTKACTTTVLHSVDECGRCVADSECKDDNHRCIEMFFNGASQGGHCLKRTATGCQPPYKIEINRASLSGAQAESYCGINEMKTSCEAVLGLFGNAMCGGGLSCAGAGAVCGTVGTLTERCTYACDLSGDCPNSTACVASGSGKYCK